MCGSRISARAGLGFHQPQRGTVLVDGVSLSDLDLASWRSRIGVVNQDAYIFDDTVKANILYGRLEASDDDVIAAARLACADDFINEMAQGYDTVVGDRGTQVSGGQRQRVAMGRAIVRNPKIFLFDEPLSNLDAKLRVQMRMEIRKLQRELGVTSVYVTHDQIEAMTLADTG